MAKRLAERDIEAFLHQLESGELSDDNLEEDEDEIGYYADPNEVLADLEDSSENLEDVDGERPIIFDDENDSDPPLVSNEEVEPPPLPSTSSVSVTGNVTTRNLVWKRKNLNLVEEALAFKGNIPYPQNVDVMKADVPRGSYCANVTHYNGLDLAATSWKDNKQVLLLSTYVGAEPVKSIKRFDKKQKSTVEIPCPRVIKEYNAHMGGVDLMDSYLGRYRIRMKSRKWTTRLFYHLLDMTVINAWVLYKKVLTKKGENPKQIMNLADFRTDLAESLCKYRAYDHDTKRGRPSSSRLEEVTIKKARTTRAHEQVMPTIDVRFDNVGHEREYCSKRNKCKYNNCRKLTSIMCSKCKVSLCNNRNNNCFYLFHKK